MLPSVVLALALAAGLTAAQADEGWHGFAAESRDKVDGWRGVVLVDTAHPVSSAGVVTAVQIHAKRVTSVLEVGVFRKTGAGDCSFSYHGKVKLIKKNVYNAGVNTVEVLRPVAVSPGDYLGVFMKQRGALSYSLTETDNYCFDSEIKKLTEGDEVDLTLDSKNVRNREYSFRWQIQTITAPSLMETSPPFTCVMGVVTLDPSEGAPPPPVPQTSTPCFTACSVSKNMEAGVLVYGCLPDRTDLELDTCHVESTQHVAEANVDVVTKYSYYCSGGAEEGEEEEQQPCNDKSDDDIMPMCQP